MALFFHHSIFLLVWGRAEILKLIKLVWFLRFFIKLIRFDFKNCSIFMVGFWSVSSVYQSVFADFENRYYSNFLITIEKSWRRVEVWTRRCCHNITCHSFCAEQCLLLAAVFIGCTILVSALLLSSIECCEQVTYNVWGETM
jgi:hypothetical protein